MSAHCATFPRHLGRQTNRAAQPAADTVELTVWAYGEREQQGDDQSKLEDFRLLKKNPTGWVQ